MGNALEVDGIEVLVEGDGEPALLMIHGWPDTLRLWDAQVAALRERCRCVRFTLPGFDVGRPCRPLPMSMSQTIALIGRIADAVSPQRPVLLMLHDWGCAFGYQFALAQPSRVQGIVGVDIGDAGSAAHRRSLTAAAKAAIVAYQVWLAAAWRIGGRRGDAMTRRMARWARAPADPRLVGSTMNYPYYLLWTGGYGSYRHRVDFEPPCPMLYLYGRRKPFMFHSPRWAAALAARPGCRVQGLDTGHWPMIERPDEFNRIVRDWIALQV
ncbi:alpha/beta fold hydrolase [Caldimonas tepidiphila]|uniref:alpha/beta fold hydrolase n=1 Tax=Caldimonas tepidiphila TaxID=2315841 RepID=UPI000E5AC056|nr:alpha/beta hydrolase [Caldimonas tepidiphila]